MDRISAYDPSFRKAPSTVKNILFPSFQSNSPNFASASPKKRPSFEGFQSLEVTSDCGSENQDPSDSFQWHEFSIEKMQHPTTGEPLILVRQSDVTIRVAIEKAMWSCAYTQLNMVSSIFPLHVVEHFNNQRIQIVQDAAAVPMRLDVGHLARSHKSVTILFMDIVGFTSMSKEVEPQVVMQFLNDLFGRFDDLIEEYKVQKVETAGDCYIVAAGVLAEGPDGFSEVLATHDPRVSASRVLSFAQFMLHQARMMRMPNNGEPVVIRIGVHTGDCVSGLVGSKLHKFGLFGDSMNTASRMESTCQPGKIQISSSTYSMLTERQRGSFEATGGVEVKGKGVMETYLWIDEPALNLGAPLSEDFNALMGSSPSEVFSGLGLHSTIPHGSAHRAPPIVAMAQACQDALSLLRTISNRLVMNDRSSSMQQCTYLKTHSNYLHHLYKSETGTTSQSLIPPAPHPSSTNATTRDHSNEITSGLARGVTLV